MEKGSMRRTKNVEGDGFDEAARPESFCTCHRHTLSVEEEMYKEVSYEHRRNMATISNILLGLRQPYSNVLEKIRYRWARLCCDVVSKLCCPPCPGAIITKFALYRLKRPSYDFLTVGRCAKDEAKAERRLRAFPSAYLLSRIDDRRYLAYFAQLRCFNIDDGSGGRLACIFASGLSSTPPAAKLALLFSHSNGCDLGVIAGYVIRLARRYGAQVISYDYPGFGQSSGSCCDEGVYKSVNAVYDYLTTTLKVPSDQIVAIGTSLGSAATIHLAATRPVKAVVLQGAFLSAMRAVCPYKRRVWMNDRFTNIEKVVNIKAPTLFVHGTKDEIFSLRHAEILRDNCPGAKNIEPYYMDGGHLSFEYDEDYYNHLHKFLHREVMPLDEDSVCCSHKVTAVRYQLKWQAAMNGIESKPAANSENPRIPIALCLAQCWNNSAGLNTRSSDSSGMMEMKPIERPNDIG